MSDLAFASAKFQEFIGCDGVIEFHNERGRQLLIDLNSCSLPRELVEHLAFAGRVLRDTSRLCYACSLRRADRIGRTEFVRRLATTLGDHLPQLEKSESCQAAKFHFLVKVTQAGLRDLSTACVDGDFMRAWHIAEAAYNQLAAATGGFRPVDLTSLSQGNPKLSMPAIPLEITTAAGPKRVFAQPMQAFNAANYAEHLGRLTVQKFNVFVHPGIEIVKPDDKTGLPDKQKFYFPIVFVRAKDAPTTDRFGLAWRGPAEEFQVYDYQGWQRSLARVARVAWRDRNLGQLQSGQVEISSDGLPTAVRFVGPNALNRRVSQGTEWLFELVAPVALPDSYTARRF